MDRGWGYLPTLSAAADAATARTKGRGCRCRRSYSRGGGRIHKLPLLIPLLQRGNRNQRGHGRCGCGGFGGSGVHGCPDGLLLLLLLLLLLETLSLLPFSLLLLLLKHLLLLLL